MSKDQPQTTKPDVEDELADLVAYLDGEMDEPSAELMERRLTSDNPLRQRADALDVTWQLLDSLEDVGASGEFAQKTLSSLETIEAAPDSPQDFGTRIKRALFQSGVLHNAIGWLVLAFLLASLGLTIGRLTARPQRANDDVQMLQQLPLLKHYHQYRLLPDADFLQDVSLPAEVDPGEELP